MYTYMQKHPNTVMSLKQHSPTDVFTHIANMCIYIYKYILQISNYSLRVWWGLPTRSDEKIMAMQ